MLAPLKTFELFPLLPVELRNEIFAAAIQPRFVRIGQRVKPAYARGEARYEILIQRAHEEIAQMHHSAMDDPPKTYTEILSSMLGPNCDSESMLDYFRRQETLHKTSRTGLHTQTPVYRHSLCHVDWCLLDRFGVTAIKFAMRTSHIWSSSPIPALLHTCRDSRRTMQILGYELAFRINDSAIPNVWVNFEHDIFETDMYTIEIDKLPSQDVSRIERLAVSRYRGIHHLILPAILPVARQLRQVMWVVHNFLPPNRWTRNYNETEGNLCGYLECDTPEFLNHNFVNNATIEAWPEYAQKLLNYQKNNAGNTDGFWALEEKVWEDEYRKLRDETSGSWLIPKWKHVFIVTKEQAGQILAFRERVLRGLMNVECLENEEGPRMKSYHPFDDDCDVLDEIREADRFRYYF